ncbi:MAG: hypothetical protein FWF90_15815 [Promicromonosporaceae bacterium]|nr:hypothetical protein [Promicromonosporaceae bacterium]
MRFVRLDGPFCRRCGIATVRDMTAKSLVQGWWGYASSVINPITMLLNVGPMLKFKRLPEPEAGYREPLHLGKPLFRRPEILGLLVPVAVVALIVAAVVSSTDHRAVAGACIVNRGTDDAPQIAVVDCGGDEAAYRIVGRVDGVADDSQCDQFRDAVATYTQEADSATYTLCLAPVGNAS